MEISTFEKRELIDLKRAAALGMLVTTLAMAAPELSFAASKDNRPPVPTDVNAPNVYNVGQVTEFATGLLNPLVEAFKPIFSNMPQERCYKWLWGYNQALAHPQTTAYYEGIAGAYQVPGEGDDNLTAADHSGSISYTPGECTTLIQTKKIMGDYNSSKPAEKSDKSSLASQRLGRWARALFIFIHEHEHANDSNYFEFSHNGNNDHMSQESFADCKAASKFRWVVKRTVPSINKKTMAFLAKEAQGAEYDFNTVTHRYDYCWTKDVTATGSLDLQFAWSPDQVQAWSDLKAKLYK